MLNGPQSGSGLGPRECGDHDEEDEVVLFGAGAGAGEGTREWRSLDGRPGCPQPADSAAVSLEKPAGPEEAWQKRRRAIARMKVGELYRILQEVRDAEGAECPPTPRTPDPDEPGVSKRAWSARVSRWRHDVRAWLMGRRGDSESVGGPGSCGPSGACGAGGQRPAAEHERSSIAGSVGSPVGLGGGDHALRREGPAEEW